MAGGQQFSEVKIVNALSKIKRQAGESHWGAHQRQQRHIEMWEAQIHIVALETNGLQL